MAQQADPLALVLGRDGAAEDAVQGLLQRLCIAARVRTLAAGARLPGWAGQRGLEMLELFEADWAKTDLGQKEFKAHDKELKAAEKEAERKARKKAEKAALQEAVKRAEQTVDGQKPAPASAPNAETIARIAAEAAPTNLEKLTVVALRQLAKERGMTGYSRLPKAMLVDLLS